MKTYLSVLVTFGSFQWMHAQEKSEHIIQHQNRYKEAYEYLTAMLEDDTTSSFKNAVFTVENAFMNGILDYDTFNLGIQHYANSAKLFSQNSTLLYEGLDKENIQKLGSIFMVMTSTKPFFVDSTTYFEPAPFIYDFDDFWGDRDWTKMFITKLLATHSGNCHSLPYLYKIIADELDGKAYLSMAPNHTYIKIRSQNPRIGWYNTELTNATFPIDAWIKSSGYVHLDAIRNGLYMDTLGVKQEIAICLVDLAKGYERLYDDTDFVLKCAEQALKYYPNYVNAMLLKAETMKRKFELIITHGSKEIENDEQFKALFEEMEALYFTIFKLGYRTMPREMYVSWLTDLKENKEKYLNKNFTNNFTTNED